MTYQKQPNPYIGPDGRIIPGMAGLASVFAKQEDEKWLASLSEEERAEELRQRWQLHEHMNISMPAEYNLK
ncbi:hypothetical protein ACFPMF_15290 [Larkinella bovis]|uniref:Uncharacterized protein n=1 Tax=Larkinella bovis TaxID=683041 RepID=A0ABW0IE82_9BACT